VIRPRRTSIGAAPLVLSMLLACSGEPEPSATDPAPDLPPGARPELVAALREAVEAVRHPSDGGGRAWLDPAESDAHAVISTPGRFTIVYEVGPLGIATGGTLSFQVSPFWDWSTPQVEAPESPGFTRVEPSAEDIELDVRTLDQQLLGITVTGRPLVAGETLRIVYGDGYGALADRFAEKQSRFYVAVDGDGDGVRAFLVDSPGVDVRPGPPARLHVVLPTVARPGEEIRVTVAVLDGLGNADVEVEGEVTFRDVPAALEMPARVHLRAEDRGTVEIRARAREPGLVRIGADGPGELTALSNPMEISEAGPRILWGDLHGHSSWSDGTGTAEDYFRYARDVANLDVVALSDHDHWGILPLDQHPFIFEKIRAATRAFHDPGRFVTLLAYEWTSWIYGHRHVVYFSDEGGVLSSLDRDTETPAQLWKALAGQSALTFAHHSAGGPIATDWSFPPDPILEPLTEIVSVHGSSEALDSPIAIYSPVPGNFVRDALDRGYRFGFVGSGDSHDGHPGLAQLAAVSGGLAAILSEDRTRESVLAAMRARRVYATNGPRILLRTALGPHKMGAAVTVPEGAPLSETLFVRVVAVEPLARIDLVRSGEVVASINVEGRLDVELQLEVEDLRAGEYLYVRAIQIDQGTAWSSPIFFE
jgi:hypothetical protein